VFLALHLNTHSIYASPDFSGLFWRNSLITGVVLYGGYKFLLPANAEDQSNFITRFISSVTTPTTVWLDMNSERVAANADAAKAKVLTQSAEKPKINRSKFPL
jgi:hypothetical protein